MNKFEFQTISEKVESWTAEGIVRWAGDTFGPGLVLTCSFGGGGLVLAHMLRASHPEVPILFLDTGFHFPETLQFKKEMTERLDLRVVDVHPELTVEEQAAAHGPRLYARNPDLCCAQRKVAPLTRALIDMGATAWMAALRRDQSPTRRHIRVLERHVVTDPFAVNGTSRSRTVVKIHPLARWRREDVDRYMAMHDLPHHPLLDEGYASIGCAPCTRPAAEGDERSGRWAGTHKTECGLHTFTKPVPPPGT